MTRNRFEVRLKGSKLNEYVVTIIHEQYIVVKADCEDQAKKRALRLAKGHNPIVANVEELG